VDVAGSASPLRAGHTSVIYKDFMYVFGGWDGECLRDEMLELDLSQNMWTELPTSGKAPCARYRHTAVVCSNGMFVFGGAGPSASRFADLHAFNFTSRTWSLVNDAHRLTSKVDASDVQPPRRAFHGSLVHGNEMFIFGGWNGRMRNDNYRLVLRSETDQRMGDEQSSEAGSSSTSAEVTIWLGSLSLISSSSDLSSESEISLADLPLFEQRKRLRPSDEVHPPQLQPIKSASWGARWRLKQPRMRF